MKKPNRPHTEKGTWTWGETIVLGILWGIALTFVTIALIKVFA